MKGSKSHFIDHFIHSHKHKVNSLFLFSLFLPFLVFAYASAEPLHSDSVLVNVSTKVNIAYDNKETSFYTTKFYLDDALREWGIEVGEKDAVFPEPTLKLNGGEVTAKLQRANSFLYEEGQSRMIIFSGYNEPIDVLRQNNIFLYPEDRIEKELVTDFYKDQAVGIKIKVVRAPVIYINVDGARKEIRSWSKTVAEVLKEGNILVGEKDEITPTFAEAVVNNTEITIVRVAESEVVETEIIPFKTSTIEDPTTYIGKSYVKQEGVNGSKENAYLLRSENGILVSKELIYSKILSNPAAKIIVKGTKPYNANYWWDTLVAAGGKYGISPLDMHKVMICESGGNPYSGAGSAYQGLFQWDGSFYKWAALAGYPNSNILDGEAQIYATALRVSRSGGWSAWGCKP